MNDKTTERLIRAYERMLERIRDWAEEFEDKSVEALEEALEEARDKVSELEELTREEAEQVRDWVRRDLAHLAEHFEVDEDLRAWFRMDLALIEDELIDLFRKLADPTTLALLRLKAEAARQPWRTGEVTGPGVLECTNCGERLHFTRTAHIPPCPKCHGTEFRRVGESG